MDQDRRDRTIELLQRAITTINESLIDGDLESEEFRKRIGALSREMFVLLGDIEGGQCS